MQRRARFWTRWRGIWVLAFRMWCSCFIRRLSCWAADYRSSANRCGRQELIDVGRRAEGSMLAESGGTDSKAHHVVVRPLKANGAAVDTAVRRSAREVGSQGAHQPVHEVGLEVVGDRKQDPVPLRIVGVGSNLVVADRKSVV